MENKGLFTRNTALIFDDEGRYKDKKNFSPSKESFTHKERTYFIKSLENSSYIIFKKFPFGRRYYFLYNENYSFPLRINLNLINSKKIIPDTATINAILRSDAIRKLNRGSALNELLKNPKMLLIIIAVIGAIIYFLSTGGLK